MWFDKWLGRRPKKLIVDFDREAVVPKGVERVLWHKPAARGKVALEPHHLDVRPIPRGMTYEQYRVAHPNEVFADIGVLDAVVANAVASGRIDQRAIQRVLGDFKGQIFFLGTAFEGTMGGKTIAAFAYLNWGTHYPYLRAVCPADNPINHDVHCCACHIRVPALLA